MKNTKNYYSPKQSYYAGLFLGQLECLKLTRNAPMIDGWTGFPKGFNWKEYKRGFKDGWNQGKLCFPLPENFDNIMAYDKVLTTDFAKKMYEAFDKSEKVY